MATKSVFPMRPKIHDVFFAATFSLSHFTSIVTYPLMLGDIARQGEALRGSGVVFEEARAAQQVGHALEAGLTTGKQLRHGELKSLGMDVKADLAELRGTKPTTSELHGEGLPKLEKLEFKKGTHGMEPGANQEPLKELPKLDPTDPKAGEVAKDVHGAPSSVTKVQEPNQIMSELASKRYARITPEQMKKEAALLEDSSEKILALWSKFGGLESRAFQQFFLVLTKLTVRKSKIGMITSTIGAAKKLAKTDSTIEAAMITRANKKLAEAGSVRNMMAHSGYGIKAS